MDSPKRISTADTELLTTILKLIPEQGHQGFAEAMRLLVDAAMRRESPSSIPR